MKIVDKNKYGKLSEDILNSFEQKLGAKLPSEYRKFLLKNNGGIPEKRYFSFITNESAISEAFYGLHSGPEHLRLDSIYKLLYSRLPNGMLPIASDPFGNQICIVFNQKTLGTIIFWDHELKGEENTISTIASNFPLFLNKLYTPELCEDSFDVIFQNDDANRLEQKIGNGIDVESLDGNGRSLIENAAIQNATKCIQLLFERGAKFRNALQLAKKNAEFFPGHADSVKLLVSLGTKDKNTIE